MLFFKTRRGLSEIHGFRGAASLFACARRGFLNLLEHGVRTNSIIALTFVLGLSCGSAAASAQPDVAQQVQSTSVHPGSEQSQPKLEAKVAPTDNADAPAFMFSDLFRLASSGEIVKVHILEKGVSEVTMKDGKTVHVRTPDFYSAWATDLAKAGVIVELFDPPNPKGGRSLTDWAMFALSLAWDGIVALMAIVMVFYLLQMLRTTLGGAGVFVRPETRFSDVAGVEEAKVTLGDIVEYLKNPAKFTAIGARARKGVLLVGPPGGGKTLLAKAMAGEANVPFMAVSGSEFQEMFVGVGAARLRGMFRRLKKRAPCILFIDEIDSVGRARGGGTSAADKEHSATLNELLTQMDGFPSVKGIVVIAATNLVEVLDTALTRPGRFDLLIDVPPPDMKAREAILKVSANGVKLAEDVDFKVVARGTPGFSGADLATLVNEAALRAAKRDAEAVFMVDLEAARDAKLLGGEKREFTLDPEDLETIIYHESGHAIVQAAQPECDPIHKATVSPRGRALGFVAQLPLKDRVLVRRSKMRADLIVLLAGRASEELKFGPDMITNGASADIEQATKIAHEMVARYGMGKNLAKRTERSMFSTHVSSERALQQIDGEVDALLDDCFEQAKVLLTKHKAALEALANRFREQDTLTGDEILAVIATNTPVNFAAG